MCVLKYYEEYFAVLWINHIFAMFFMVLDLRLTKIGTQRSPFFYAHK